MKRHAEKRRRFSANRKKPERVAKMTPIHPSGQRLTLCDTDHFVILDVTAGVEGGAGGWCAALLFRTKYRRAFRKKQRIAPTMPGRRWLGPHPGAGQYLTAQTAM